MYGAKKKLTIFLTEYWNNDRCLIRNLKYWLKFEFEFEFQILQYRITLNKQFLIYCIFYYLNWNKY